GGGNDTVNGGSGGNELYGEAGNDTLSGHYTSNNLLDGGEGDDTLKLSSASSYARSYSNSFRGGLGDDIISGSYSQDTYHYDLGDGHDQITDVGDISSSSSYKGPDKIIFGADISRDMVQLTHNAAGDLVITITDPNNAANNGQIVVKYGYISASSHIEAIEFAGDTSGASNLSEADIMAAGALMLGTASDDVITGTSIADVIEGGAGNDILNAGGGSDTYQFDSGSGQDIINNYDSSSSSIDVARFDDVSIEDLWFSRDGNNLQINIIGTDDQVEVNNWYNGANYQVDQIQVGNSVLLNNQLEQLVSAMASFDVPSNAGSVVTQATKDELQPILVESWQTL
ncbi:calcium-binding protein, partial [Shewanella sp. YLB-07]|uniref:calcium-binding protein n=1 Tax=Shewanella sp. YLB-07 TaxID=2601268 RepID=UPI0012CF558A